MSGRLFPPLVANCSLTLLAAISALCFITVPPTSAVGQSADVIPVVAPEEVGLSTERLKRIGVAFQGYIDRKEAAGAMAVIARKGKVAYVGTWGTRDREAGTELTQDTIFRIYSMSKPITSVAVMILFEEGKLFLDDPISKFMPEFASMKVQKETPTGPGKPPALETSDAKRPITVRDLLRHTAGLTYGIFGNTQVDQQYRQIGILTNDKTIGETVSKLHQMPLLFEPGSQWHYSVSVDVAGRLVEVVSKQSFDEFLKDKLFGPLGMVDTDFRVPKSKLPRFAALYTPKGSPKTRDAYLLPPPQTKEIERLETNDLAKFGEDNAYFSGGGGLVSTAQDYLRFCQMLLNGGELDGKRILSRKSVELMTADHMYGISGFNQKGMTFGLGFSVVTDVAERQTLGSVGTFGWGGAAGTRFFIDPKEDLIGIFMVQILPHRTRMADEFQILTYQAIAD